MWWRMWRTCSGFCWAALLEHHRAWSPQQLCCCPALGGKSGPRVRHTHTHTHSHSHNTHTPEVLLPLVACPPAANSPSRARGPENEWGNNKSSVGSCCSPSTSPSSAHFLRTNAPDTTKQARVHKEQQSKQGKERRKGKREAREGMMRNGLLAFVVGCFCWAAFGRQLRSIIRKCVIFLIWRKYACLCDD